MLHPGRSPTPGLLPSQGSGGVLPQSELLYRERSSTCPKSSPLRVNVARDAAPALPVEIGTALLGRTPESASGALGRTPGRRRGRLWRLGLTRRCRLLVDGSAFVVWPEAFGKECGIVAEAVAERLAQPLRGVAAGRLLALVARLAHVRRVYSTGPSPVKPGRSSRNFPRSTEKSPRPAVGRI